jgi:hypothetical protein
MASITWTTHYHRNKRDGSSTQRSFETSPDVWNRVSLGNVNHQTFVSTLSTLPMPFLLVPGEGREVKLLHHGLLHASKIGGTADAVFIHGNLSESPFKVIPIQDVTTPLNTTTTSRWTRADPFSHSPSLPDMCSAVSSEAFAALPPGDNKILQGRPNHFFISGIHFINMNGRRTFPAADLAISIISSTLRFPDEHYEHRKDQEVENQDDDDDDGLDHEKDQIKETRGSHESLLAYLWTISQSNAPSIGLIDPPEDPTLGDRIQETRAKLVNSDPAGPEHQKAITPKLLRAMYQLSGASLTALRDTPFAVIAEIAIVSFFFAMRSCEATTTAKAGRTRIIDLDGITFRDENNCIIHHSSALLANAYQVTLTFADQSKTKNDKRTQTNSGDPVLDPVRCLASIVKRILATVPDACGTTTINTMCFDNDTFLLSSTYLRDQLRHSCTIMGESATFGFDASEIGTKSLRSGAAMALFLMDYSTERIMILGRWSSNAFLVYIRPQVLERTNNMGNDMIHNDSFFDATDVPQADTDDSRTRRSLPFNGDRPIFPRLHLSH